jgi:thiol-disulfide isomerase/thioredoxin
MNAKLWIAVAGLAVSPLALAQDAQAPAQDDKSPRPKSQAPDAAASQEAVDPAAKEFIAKFRAAIKDLKDISCTSEQTSKVEGKGETFKGEVVATIIRAPGTGGAGMLKQFKIVAKGEEGETVWAFDGRKATRLEHGKKTFAEVEAPDGRAFPVMQASQVLPTWTLSDVLVNPNAKLVAAKMLPDAKANGTDCKVVAYTVEIPMPSDPESGGKEGKTVLKQVRHVGAEDLMPRRIESTISFVGEVPEGATPRTFVGNYLNIKTNLQPGKEVFALTAAEGYKTVEADAQEMGVPSNQPPKLKFAANDMAPDFVLKTPDGKEVSLAGLKGKVVLLDFWATWCGPCKAAMPSIQKLHEKYERKPVAILGVNTWEQGAANVAQKYMEKNKFTYGLLLKGDDLAKAYGLSGIPTLVLIGPDGKIIHIGVGFGPGEDEHLADLIDKALASR